MRRRRQSSVVDEPPDMQTWELRSTVLVEGKEWPDDSLGKSPLKIMYAPSGASQARNMALNRRRSV